MNLDQRLVRQALQARVALGATIALGWAAGIVTVLQAQTLSRVIGGVFLGGQTLTQVQSLLITLGVLAVGRAALLWASQVTAFAVAARVKTELRERLFAHLMVLGPVYTRGERSGELTHTVVEGIEALDAYVSQYLPQVALAALVPLTILVFILPLDLLSALVLLVTAPLIPLFMVLIGSVADGITRRQWTLLSRLNAHFLDVLQGLATLKMFGRSRAEIALLARVTERYRDATLNVLRVAFLSALVLEMVTTLSTAVVAVQVGLRLLYGALPFEQGLFVLILAPEFYLPLRLLGARFHAGVAGATAARRVFEVLDIPETRFPQASPSPKTRFPEENGLRDILPPSSIVLDGVEYAYDGGRRPALNGVSFQMRTGEKTALVGPSGAGKSTVAFLLLRFVEPSGGRILVDGADLTTLPVDAWRAQVAWVPQSPYLFNATISENIALARPSATPAEIERAAEQAHADAFIAALPQAYATVVGERGARLSGGEAQRIALARAFLKNAPILILDEATSNLDPENEALIREATGRLAQARMVLVIAHRLATVVRADHVVVLDQGRVVEHGTHSTLVQQDGLYRKLVSAYAGN